MLRGKFWATSAVALGLVVLAPAAANAAEVIIIQPSERSQSITGPKLQEAAPTRMFTVDKALTLMPGQNRFSGGVQVGGLGIGGLAPSMSGGLNLRADMGLRPGLETGIAISGLGAGGLSNLLGNIDLNGKMMLSDMMMGSIPTLIGGQARLGALASGGGIGGAAVGVGVPITMLMSPNVNVTVNPGLAMNFAGAGFLPGGTPATLGATFTPTLGAGLDWRLLDKLDAMIDGQVGFAGVSNGSLGVRYGFNDSFVGDLRVGVGNNTAAGNLMNNSLVGIGGTYAF